MVEFAPGGLVPNVMGEEMTFPEYELSLQRSTPVVSATMTRHMLHGGVHENVGATPDDTETSAGQVHVTVGVMVTG